MPFDWTIENRNFFSRIGIKRTQHSNSSKKSGKIETQMDCFWLCAQIGLHKGEYVDISEKKSPTEKIMINKEFAGNSSIFGKEIMGVVFYRFVESKGMLEDNQDSMLGLMREFFSESNPDELSSEGYRFLNGYAEGGFQFLHSIFDDDCSDKVEFLIEYSSLFEDNMREI
jgi:hypothetical protein